MAERTPGDVRGVFERIEREFQKARFCKPAEMDGGFEQKMAPLIVEEITQPSSESPSIVRVEDALEEKQGAGQHIVYYESKPIPVGHKRFELVTYVWFYQDRHVCQIDEGPTPLLVRGVRIMLGADGMPMLWQAITDPSHLQVFFVSQSLESAAKKQFGDPLPERRFSIERSEDEFPQVVVVNAIDDGPVPMGPYVYVDASPQRVISTIHCRCSASQFSEVIETVQYELAPMKAIDTERLRHRMGIDVNKLLEPPSLEALFRWPKSEP